VDRDDALERFRTARVGRIATLTPDERPHVVPLVFALVDAPTGPRVYWVVDRKPKRSELVQRLRNIEQHPAVEVVVDGYDEDWDALWWVRVSGNGRVVDAEGERSEALGSLRDKYPQYAAALPTGAVVAIDVERVSGWSAAEAGR